MNTIQGQRETEKYYIVPKIFKNTQLGGTATNLMRKRRKKNIGNWFKTRGGSQRGRKQGIVREAARVQAGRVQP